MFDGGFLGSLMQREEIAASRERQQQELQEKARQKDELLRQRRLARVADVLLKRSEECCKVIFVI
jgi:hypothetical protein